MHVTLIEPAVIGQSIKKLLKHRPEKDVKERKHGSITVNSELY